MLLEIHLVEYLGLVLREVFSSLEPLVLLPWRLLGIVAIPGFLLAGPVPLALAVGKREELSPESFCFLFKRLCQLSLLSYKFWDYW